MNANTPIQARKKSKNGKAPETRPTILSTFGDRLTSSHSTSEQHRSNHAPNEATDETTNQSRKHRGSNLLFSH